ncbi:MAG: glycosyltransferase family 2 protein [Polaribacter sp.]
MSNFKLSIITINYNNAIGLKKTMESVANQNLQNFEYIVVDGNSTDNSLSIIKSFDLSNLKWSSENDTGVYNAMNKGIKKASGNFLLFLNSGDFLVNDTIIEKVLPSLHNKFDFISGHLEFIENSETVVKKHPEKISLSYLLRSTLMHPSTFIKKSLFYEYGFYNEDLKIVSDWEFFFKTIGLNGATFKRIDIIVAHFNMDGISTSQGDKANSERESIQKKYLNVVFNHSLDEFLFNQIKNPSKRIKFLKKIENKKVLRRIATVLLKLLSKFS